MSKEAWLKAASRFRDNETNLEALQVIEKRKEAEEILRHQKAVAIQELEHFIDSDEGEAAKQLLTASQQIICFAKVGDRFMSTVYFMDGGGLYNTNEASDGSQVMDISTWPTSAVEIVNAAIIISNWKPSDFMVKLRAELDKIAASAPKASD